MEFLTTMIAATTNIIDGRVWKILEPTLIFIMVAFAIATIVVILMQKGTSDNIGAIGGESESYMGKNKGLNKDRTLKILTIVFGALLVITSIIFFILQVVD